MKINAIVASRMSSTRLPGKILKTLANKPALVQLINRIKKSKYINDIVIATTINSNDDILVSTAIEEDLLYYRGSEKDVLKRTVEAAVYSKTDFIVQITSDCPLIDAETIDCVIDRMINNPYLDYVSNQLIRTYPLGFAVEIFRTTDLIKIEETIFDEAVREHVSLYFYENPELFKISNVEAPNFLRNPHYRLTLDTIQDYELISNIYDNLYIKNPNFSLYNITNYLNQHPELLNINKNIAQKKPR